MFSRKCVGLLLVLLLATTAAFGQGVMGRIIGTVTDTTGAVVVGAKLDLVDQATGAKRNTTSGPDGKFVFLAVQNGLYKLTVTMQGFQTAVLPNIKVDLGQTAEVTAQLQVGQVQSEVVVEAAAEVLQTQTTAVEGGVQGRQLRGLPLNNRDVLDFVLLMPGAQQTGVTRNSTFEGLPKSALNITLDGINVQDNSAKSSATGGYFTNIRPKQDAVEEIQVTTGNNTADNAGSGAVQIKFVTRRGTNDWHGGLFEFYRDQGLNANTFFHKRTTGTPLPRTLNHLNQYGGSIGGPLIKNKLFIFNNFEDFRLPQSFARDSSILNEPALAGNFVYGPNNTTMNVLTVAAAAGLPATPDPTIMAMLNRINQVRTNAIGGAVINAGASPLMDDVTWNAPTATRRFFNTTRIDYDINDKLRWNVIGQWNHFDSMPDALNSADMPFPIAGLQSLNGGQDGRRYSLVTSLNWTISPRLNYEVRVGRTSSISHFNDGVTMSGLFPNGYGFSFDSLGLPSLFSSPGSTGYKGLPDNRDSPVITMSHSFGLVAGKHTINFGGELNVINYWEAQYWYSGVPQITIGYSDNDTAVTDAFSYGCPTCALPTGNATDAADAAALWSTLVGRVSGVGGGRNLDEITKTYKDGVPYTQRLMQKVFGLYVSDSFRATKTLTLNYGLRYEYQGATSDRKGIFVSSGYAGLWGVSGIGNIFKPGVETGTSPVYNPMPSGIYASPKMFMPSFGLSWSPNYENKVWKTIFGGPGKTVFRGGYSIASARDGLYVQADDLGNDPQYGQSIALNSGTDFLSTAPGGYAAPLMLNQYDTTAHSWPVAYNVFPSAYQFPMPVSVFTFQSGGLWGVNPKIKLPYVQSWSFGLQRELSPNTVFEARYQGNHATRLWRNFNLNEVNIFENGFLNEFQLAQQNQNICMANPTACKAAQTAIGVASPTSLSFANLGLPGQMPLPIMETALGSVGGSNAYFLNNTWNNYVRYGRAGTVANSIAGSPNRLCPMIGNRLQACADRGYDTPGPYPSNFWQANPDVAGTVSYMLSNGGDSYYDAGVIEVRRRMSKGLMIQGNYTFSKSLSNMYADSTDATVSYTTLHNTRLDRGLSPFDITHTARVFWTWELPFGPGRHFNFTGNKAINKVLEGWEFTGIAALQSGRVFKLTSGRATVNGNDAGVVLNGITVDQLQSMISVNKATSTYQTGCQSPSYVYYMPASLVDTNCQAYHWDPILYSDGKIQVPIVPGQWGQMVYLHGPHMIKPDLTLAKQTKVTERVNARFEARFFNAFNITNFLVGAANGNAIGSGITGTAFGRTNYYLQDASGNQDQGPRMIELVLRLNF